MQSFEKTRSRAFHLLYTDVENFLSYCLGTRRHIVVSDAHAPRNVNLDSQAGQLFLLALSSTFDSEQPSSPLRVAVSVQAR